MPFHALTYISVFPVPLCTLNDFGDKAIETIISLVSIRNSSLSFSFIFIKIHVTIN